MRYKFQRTIPQLFTYKKILENTNTYDINKNLVKQVNNVTGYTVRNQYTLSKKIAKSIDNYSKELLYKYDILNKVIEETEQKIDITQIITTKTKYDNLYNKIETTDGNGNVTTYEYDSNNNLVKETNPKLQITTYTYDKNENQLTETTNGKIATNAYNARNELIEVNNGQTVAEYAYNAEGKRVQKVADSITTNFVYDGDNVILELDDQNNELAINIHGLSLLKRTTNKDGYYIYNGHGDVTKILDNTNNTLNTYEYDEFGKILSENETFNNPYKYAGYYYHKETKTYYLQARYYNPEIQRFISEDTYRGKLDDPLSLNLYTYCNNNPLIYVDLTGHWPEWSQLLNEYANPFKTIAATIDGIRDVGNEMITGALSLPYTIGRALGNRIGLDLNNIGYKSGIVGQEQYLKNERNYLNGLSTNIEILKPMPENMVNGFVQNFRTTFDWNNFSNFLDSNTTFNDKKSYAKAAITTASTLYGVKNIATSVLNGLPKITYTQNPALQYAGMSSSLATAGTYTITAGTISAKSMLGNVSLIVGGNGGNKSTSTQSPNNNNSNIKTTKHGEERLKERGFTYTEVYDTLNEPTKIMTQLDGAKVYIKELENNKFTYIVEGKNGIVTGLKNISVKSFEKLSKNYGWK